MYNKIKKIILLLPLFLFPVQCSFDHKDEAEQKTIKETADTILFNSEIHVVQDSNMTIKAEKIEIYSKASRQIFNGASFQQFNEKDELTMSGTADYIVLDGKTNNMEISGNINILLSQNGTEVLGQYLHWNNEESLLTSKATDTITVKRENGTVISGKRFSVDAKEYIIYFDATAEGKIFTEDKPQETLPEEKTAAAESAAAEAAAAEAEPTTTESLATDEREEKPAAGAEAAAAKAEPTTTESLATDEREEKPAAGAEAEAAAKIKEETGTTEKLK